MKHIYEWRPTGLTPIDYNPKRWFHFNIGEVFILCGVCILIGIIGSEFVIDKFFPKPPLTACVKTINKITKLK